MNTDTTIVRSTPTWDDPSSPAYLTFSQLVILLVISFVTITTLVLAHYFCGLQTFALAIGGLVVTAASILSIVITVYIARNSISAKATDWVFIGFLSLLTMICLVCTYFQWHVTYKAFCAFRGMH